MSAVPYGQVCTAPLVLNRTCFLCPFCPNCLSAGCAEGTDGVACEKCIDTGFRNSTYSRLGSTCVPCEVFPWAILALVCVLVLVAVVACKKGFSQSVATKLKLLFDAIQILLLTLRFPILWPNISLSLMSALSFAYFNTQMSQTACSFNFTTTFYMDWLTSVIPLVISFLLIWILDRILRRKLRRAEKEEEKEKLEKQRTSARRLFVLAVLLYYAPVTSLSLKSYACESNLKTAGIWYYEGAVRPNDTNRWLYNYNLSCSTDAFQAVTFFSTFLLIFYSAIGPVILLFFTLRLRRWKLLAKKAPLHGALYESYRPNWSFLETIVLLRKFILVGLGDIYPFNCAIRGPLIQLIGGMLLTIIYLLIILLGRPFRQGLWSMCGRRISVHNIFEVVSNVVILGVQGTGLALTLSHQGRRESGSPVDITLLSMIVLLLTVWLVFFIGQIPAETNGDDWDDLRQEEQEDSPLERLVGRVMNTFTASSKVADAAPDERQPVELSELG